MKPGAGRGSTVAQDLRYGVRILARAPGFTLMAVLVLAIGIGVNVSAFSFFDMVALKPLPVPESDRIVRLERRSPNNYTSEMAVPFLSLLWRAREDALSATMAVLGVPPMQIDDDLQPAERLVCYGKLFYGTGNAVRLSAGCSTRASTTVADAPPAVVLSYGFWQRRFGGDPICIGRVIDLNKKPATVVGIAPFAFASLGGQHPDLWMPIAQQPYFIEHSKVLHDWTNASVQHVGQARARSQAPKRPNRSCGLLTDEFDASILRPYGTTSSFRARRAAICRLCSRRCTTWRRWWVCSRC